jgi:hypothetical protein
MNAQLESTTKSRRFNPGIYFLKVKIKSLVAEARIIRLEEKRNQETLKHAHIKAEAEVISKRASLRDELAKHRRYDIRNEARATYLVYGLLKGKTRKQIEGRATEELPQPMTQAEYNLRKRVGELLSKYGWMSQVKDFMGPRFKGKVWDGRDLNL